MLYASCSEQNFLVQYFQVFIFKLTHNIKYDVEISKGKCLIHTDQTTITDLIFSSKSSLVNPTSIGRSSHKRFISY